MSTQHLFTTVIKGGFCVGCGACAAIPDSGLNITYTELGTYRAQRSPEGAGGSAEVERICPFSDLSANEDTLGAYLAPRKPSRTERTATGIRNGSTSR